MKLTIKNFRCYDNVEFDFGNSGVILLSGTSGKGKTTILLAITYAIFGGTSKRGNAYKQGSKSKTYTVKLEIGNFVIQRTNSPARLLVTDTSIDETYEKEVAQGMLDERFGKSFDTISYLSQNGVGSFILLSAQEKLQFLEKFAFQGINISDIKSRCISFVKQSEKELTSVASKLEIMSQEFNKLEKPTKVDFPLKTKNIEKCIENENIKYRNAQILFKKCEKKILLLTEEINSLKIYLTKVQAQKNLIQTNTVKAEEIQVKINEIEFCGEEEFEKLEEKLKLCISQREYNKIKENFESQKMQLLDVKKQESETFKSELDSKRKNLWKKETKEDALNFLESYRQTIKDVEAIEMLRNSLQQHYTLENLNKNKQEIKALQDLLKQRKECMGKIIQQQEVYRCPSCETSLKFHDGILCLFDEETFEETENIENVELKIQKIENELSQKEKLLYEQQKNIDCQNEVEKQICQIQDQYEDSLPTFQEVENDMKEMQNYVEKNLKREKDILRLVECLDNNIFSETVKKLENDLKKQRGKMRELESSLNKNYDEEEIRGLIKKEEENKGYLNLYTEQLDGVKNDIKKSENELEKIKTEYKAKYSIIYEVEELTAQLEAKKSAKEKHAQDTDIHMKNLFLIEKHQHYVEISNRYKDSAKQVSDLKILEKNAEIKFSSASKLKNKISEAESLTIANVISTINAHAQIYLDIFFCDEPIAVRLETFKETKKTVVPKINVQIEYKGMEMDLSLLSGGELSRVNLAYTLALAEIFNSSLILLDECTASLDQELTSAVVDGIKQNFSEKLVIIIAHQVITGTFDRIIKL